MECSININFDKLYIPLLELTECLIDISYEGRIFRIKYPQNDPYKLPMTNSFNYGILNINITILLLIDKRLKKIAKGQLNIQKKNFQMSKGIVNRIIELKLFKNYLLSKNFSIDKIKEELYNGKINAKLIFDLSLNDDEDYRVTTLNANKPKKANNFIERNTDNLKKNKIKNKSIKNDDFSKEIDDSQNNNNFNNSKIINKQKDEFEDDLSDISISIEDEDFINNNDLDNADINSLYNSNELIDKVKNYLEELSNNKKNIFPNDKEKLKLLNESLYKKIIKLQENYDNNIQLLNSNNEKLKGLAKDYYQKYKNIQNNIKKDRQILKEKEEILHKNELINKEKNNQLNDNINNYKTELNYFMNELGLKEKEPKEISDNKDVNILGNILKNLYSIGYDIFTGSGLTNEEKQKIKNLLDLNEQQNDDLYDEDDEAIQAELDIGNEIVSLIEIDVNDLFIKKLINNVKIDQINAYSYSFEDSKCRKEVLLKINEQGRLITSNGQTFINWLLDNFGTSPSPNNKK